MFNIGSFLAYNSRVGDRPLRCPSNTFVQTSLVGVVSAVCVSEEEGVDVAPLQHFSKINPILEITFSGRTIFRVLLEQSDSKAKIYLLDRCVNLPLPRT